MNWIHFNLWLIGASLLVSYCVTAENSGKTNFNDDEEMLPLEQTVDHDAPKVEKTISGQPARRLLRQSFIPNFNPSVGTNTGFQLARGLIQELANPAVSSPRFARNPDVMDDIVGQFQQLGGGMTQQLLQQVSQSAPDMSKSFGQALNEALTQTNLLAQVAPGNLDFSQLAQPLSQSNLPGSIDLGQLGQSLSQNFLVGATQNLLNPMKGQTGQAAASAANAGGESTAEPGTVGAAAPNTETGTSQASGAATSSHAPKNPFEQIVGQSFLPQLAQLPQLPQLSQLPQIPPLGQLNPFGMLGQLSALAPLMPLGSEISEVRVLPEEYSPYKLSPKQVDLQPIAEMKLKAVLKEALTKKTIPILWFHLPKSHNLQRSKEDREMEEKLEIFEQQVIAELKQLQELAKMANEVKRSQIQSGTQTSTPKLNLSEIPIYDITLGDIEKTLMDKDVKMLMQTLVHKENKGFQRHQQATTKYLTDLTGTPIKRQAKTAEETLNAMEKDDMLKMMAYAYRMAALNGHDMPWIKKKINNSDAKENGESPMVSQQRQFVDPSAQMNVERQWLEEKHQQMAIEAEKQRQMFEGKQQEMAIEAEKQRRMFEDNQQKMVQSQMRQWVDPPMMQQAMPIQRQMMATQMQQQSPLQRQMMTPEMRQSMPMQNQMMDSNMPMQQHDMQRQMMEELMMNNFNMQQEMPMQGQQQQPRMRTQGMDCNAQSQWSNINMAQMRSTDGGKSELRQSPESKQDMQRQMMLPNMRQSMSMQNQMMSSKMPTQQDMRSQMMEEPMTNFNMQQQMPMQSQQQEPMMTTQEMNPKVQTPARQPIDKNMSEVNSATDDKSGHRQSAESKMPKQTSGSDTQIMPLNDPITNVGKADQMPEQRQHTDTEAQKNAANMDKDVDNMSTLGEAKSQMPENDGKARFKDTAIDEFLDKLLFKKHQQKSPTVINYYYNSGRYQPPPPVVPQRYGQAGGYIHYPPPPPALQYKPVRRYGGVATNSYGSPISGYRTATGDEEIAIMLQQQQQPMPVTFFRK